MPMLGFYESFPRAHMIMRFAALTSDRNLQRKLTQTLHALNAQTYSLEKIADPSIPECTVSFEFGIAQEDGFNYLDDDETHGVLKTISHKPLQVMDFLCVARYHRQQGEKRTPLRFDYSLIRFAFRKGLMDVHVFHERGPRHTSPEDIPNLIVSRVNEGSPRKLLKKT